MSPHDRISTRINCGRVSILTPNKKKIVIRFLHEVDEIVGADLEKYGPFKTEDIATIPYENAQALIAKNVATKVHLED